MFKKAINRKIYIDDGNVKTLVIIPDFRLFQNLSDS